MIRPVPAALLVVLATVLVTVLGAGCEGAPPPSPAAAPADAAVHDEIAALFAGDHPSRDDEAAGTCFARELLDRTTVPDLESAGVLVDGEVTATLPVLDRATAEHWTDAQLACTDFVAESTRAQVAVTRGRIDPEQYAGCLREALPADALRAALVGTLTGAWDSAEVAGLTTAQADCSAAAVPADRAAGPRRLNPRRS